NAPTPNERAYSGSTGTTSPKPRATTNETAIAGTITGSSPSVNRRRSDPSAPGTAAATPITRPRAYDRQPPAGDRRARAPSARAGGAGRDGRRGLRAH